MKPLSGLFKPIPFLMRYPVLHEKYFADEMYTLQLRPFSIMEDIATAYTWINKPRLICSGHIKSYQRNMLKYYKNILDSSDSQTFMILQNSTPVCQVDLLQATADPLHSRLATGMHDVSLRYLAEFRTTSSLFRNSIHLCLDYLFSFTEEPAVFTNLLPAGLITGEEFTAIGFKYIDGYLHNDEIMKVFSCKRDELKRSEHE